MADMTPVYEAMRAADAAGDTESVKKLAAYLDSQSHTDGNITVDISDPSALTDADRAALSADINSSKVANPQKQVDIPDQAMPWSDVATQAISNMPKSTMGIIKGVADTVAHPIDTITNLHDIARGAAQNMLPESWQAKDSEAQREKAALVGQFYKDRYGSMEGFKRSLAQDPAGVMADASTLATGGGALVSKLPKLSNAAISAGKTIDPLIAASKVAPAIGRGAANLIGGIGTHTGGESIRLAARSGLEGGKMAEDFVNNLRGNVPITDVLDKFKANLQQMGAEKAAAYREGMRKVNADKSILDFNGIDNALADSFNKITFKGQAKNIKALDAHSRIADEINAWKQLDPAEFHTPEGLDALKRRIGGIQESIPFEEKTARMAAGNIYNAVKDEISKQAPVYSKTMKDYTEASDLINEIERTLSMKGTASVDTSMRKLQSLMRNNVNTNYGNRLDLAKKLEQQGGNELMSSLAGQALNSWTPRGFGSAMMGASGAGGFAAGGPSLAVPILAAQSPRLMGELSHAVGIMGRLPYKAAGKVSEVANDIGVSPGIVANLLYQANQQKKASK